MTDTELWDAYWADRSPDARNALVIRYLPLVRIAADPILRRLPSHVDYDDPRVAGVFGLMDAITKFNPDKAVKFETYAVNRIRGAVIDELRSLDWVPRTVRTRAKRYETAVAELEAILGRAPTVSEVADELGVDECELRTIAQEAVGLVTRSLDSTLVARPHGAIEYKEQQDAGGQLGDVLHDRRAEVQQQAAIGDFSDHLAHHVATLPEKSRLVISLAYIECMTLAQMGRVLGVSESRVSQLQSGALRDIQSRLEGSHV